MDQVSRDLVGKVLEGLAIELPSWGFANTGTRFGKFIQPGAATTIEEKLADAAQVHRFTGCCPRVAVHVAWDFPGGPETAESVAAEGRRLGVSIGSINPTLFEDQAYKYGSFGNPDPSVRQKALEHVQESIACMRAAESSELVLWFADGSNYPGTAHIRNRKQWFEEALVRIAGELKGSERMLVEYKPFEPAFYHTDIADWGMAHLLAWKAGPRARVLVDTGHHYQGQNIEQIVAWLLSEGMLGGFHFNDRRYADDDLTVGSIDPYQLFRIFFEIHLERWDTGRSEPISYMVDQSHNLKGKIEAMIQTVMTVQELFAKAALVDFAALTAFQMESRIIDAEECLKDAFKVDIRDTLRNWRSERGLPADPLEAFRAGGYLQQIESDRAGRNRASGGYV
jgi:L-rhamnose isomerase/sugar isomerase